MTHKSTWKKAEQRAAKAFGTTRAPLSGGNGKQTRSDSLHPDLFLSCKLRAKCAVRSLYDEEKPKADKEHKTPVLVLNQKGRQGSLLVIHIDDMEKVCEAWMKSHKEENGE